MFFGCETFDEYDCESDMEYGTTELIDSEKASRIANIICNTVNSNEIIGIQVSILDSLDESWDASLGTTDLKQKSQLESSHILRIGSVTKIFTSTLILRLVEDNYLQLDQSISEFFPDHEEVEDVTIRNLLNHTSGIRDIFTMPSVFISASTMPDKNWNPNHLAETCIKKGLDFSPGSDQSYSNTNFIILGLIAEKATGKDIDQLFAEYITEPAGLNSTYLVPYMGTPRELVNGYVHHFALSFTEWYITEPENTAWSTLGFTAGAMATNSIDLSKFTYKLFNGQIISTESLEQMTNFRNDKGLGIFRINANGNYYWGHEGEITGFESITAYNPETGIIISMCCNTTPFDIHSLLYDIDEVL